MLLKTASLLHEMLPPIIARQLLQGRGLVVVVVVVYCQFDRTPLSSFLSGRRVAAEHFDDVSIFFSDIVGFTEMSAAVSPIAVVDFLNNLYNIFDRVLEDFDVYKVVIITI